MMARSRVEKTLVTPKALRGAVAALASLLSLAALPIPTLEGRWRLVEQRYGSGSANLASVEAPVRLEFFVSGARLSGRIWARGESSKSLPWPALLTDHGPHPLVIRQVLFHPGNDRVRAVYRTRPSSPEGDVFEIAEEYRLAEGGTALLGTVTVSSVAPGGVSGSYILERRFEREP